MAPALRLRRRTAEVAGTQGEGRTTRERGRGRPAHTDTSPLEVFPAAHGALLAQTTHPGLEHTFQCEWMNGSVCAFVPSVLRHFIHRSLSHGLRSGGQQYVCVHGVYIAQFKRNSALHAPFFRSKAFSNSAKGASYVTC